MASPQDFGNNLRLTRQKLKIKQKELAQSVGISAQSLGLYEKGMKFPPLEVAVRLAQALGVSLDWLTGRSTPEEVTQKEKAGNVAIRTKGDVAREIVTLLDTGTIHIENDVQTLRGGIMGQSVIVSDYLGDFLSNLSQLQSLLLSGGLSREVYDLAVEGLCSKLDSEDVPAHPV